MDNINNLLVIARKFNDIYYAVSTAEWGQFKRRVLVIFADGEFSRQFPLQSEFDDVITLDTTETRRNNLRIIREIRRLKNRIQSDAVMVSNIVLVVNQYLIKMSKSRQIYLLEDGLMNYYDFQPSASKIKRVVQLFLGIDESGLLGRIVKTYLLAPSMARYYSGEPVQLKLHRPRQLMRNPDVEGKRIFVGQCLYKFGYMSLDTYNAIVNRIIMECNIDYYLPHAFASKDEHIDCPILEIGDSHVTLEVLASEFDFDLYSFCSSVLYTTRIINSRIKSYLIRIPELSEKSEVPVIKEYCSQVIDI